MLRFPDLSKCCAHNRSQNQHCIFPPFFISFTPDALFANTDRPHSLPPLPIDQVRKITTDGMSQSLRKTKPIGEKFAYFAATELSNQMTDRTPSAKLGSGRRRKKKNKLVLSGVGLAISSSRNCLADQMVFPEGEIGKFCWVGN